jgi:hypothetical protein
MALVAAIVAPMTESSALKNTFVGDVKEVVVGDWSVLVVGSPLAVSHPATSNLHGLPTRLRRSPGRCYALDVDHAMKVKRAVRITMQPPESHVRRECRS